MKAYRLSIALILFMLSFPIAGALGFFPSNPGDVPRVFSNVSINDWGSLALTGTSLFVSIGAIAAAFLFRLNLGAVVFAVVFTVTTFPFGAVMNYIETFGMSSTVSNLISTALAFVFVFAFIQLAGGGVGE